MTKPPKKPPPPWRKKRSAASRKCGSIRLTAEERVRARRRAQRAGRRYPDLVDNMWVAQRHRKERVADMSRQELRRKGSWAVRFYGRSGKLPPLKDDKGKPTRFALTAAAWGEPVPRTVTAARRIAARGQALLKRYRRLREKSRLHDKDPSLRSG